MEKTWLRVIGDVHGKYNAYVPLAQGAEYSLCVGDVGFNYNYLDCLNAEKHRAIGGNHDNYTAVECTYCKGKKCEKCEMRGYWFCLMSKHFLGDYGLWEVPGFGPIFYVRGAWSIDQQWRTINVSWWKDEELTREQFARAAAKYQEVKPEFVVTHTVPASIIPKFFKKNMFGDTVRGSFTEAGLDTLYQVHQPKKWIFGHWHLDWTGKITHESGKETEFICLNELKYVDFQKVLDI
jgi:hypothetical protein